MGLFRRSLWETIPFDESLPTMEDSAWALEQLKRGHRCRRLNLPFQYQRGGQAREYIFALITFQLAARHGLRVTWLGVAPTLRRLLADTFRRTLGRPVVGVDETASLRRRLAAWMSWRFVHPSTE